MLDELLSVRDVARECQRSEETVRRWIWGGKVRALKIGNKLFVRRGDLVLLQQRVAPREVEERLGLLREIDALRALTRSPDGRKGDVVADLDRMRSSGW